jgi:hypothetical protein
MSKKQFVDIQRVKRKLEFGKEMYQEEKGNNTRSYLRFMKYEKLLNDGKLTQKHGSSLNEDYAYLAVVLVFVIRDHCCHYRAWKRDSLAIRFLFALQHYTGRPTTVSHSKQKLLEEIQAFIIRLYNSGGNAVLEREHVKQQLNDLYDSCMSLSCLLSMNEQCDHVLMVYEMLA